MQFDYSKLLGRIRERGHTQKSLATAIGMSEGTMSLKLNNEAYFGQKEMLKICDVLEIPYTEIGSYFFAEKVRNFRTSGDEVSTNEE